MRIGIVGHEAAKFTKAGEAQAKEIIHSLLAGHTLVSGGCHLGGVDIWAEEISDTLGNEKIIHRPVLKSWPHYRRRNLLIVQDSQIVHCIAVRRLAMAYDSIRFSSCYHCNTMDHVKGGGCWTMKQAKRAGKLWRLHIVDNPED